jgi:hypothetical protein
MTVIAIEIISRRLQAWRGRSVMVIFPGVIVGIGIAIRDDGRQRDNHHHGEQNREAAKEPAARDH